MVVVPPVRVAVVIIVEPDVVVVVTFGAKQVVVVTSVPLDLLVVHVSGCIGRITKVVLLLVTFGALAVVKVDDVDDDKFAALLLRDC